MKRANIKINGIVQGVGFRPFLHRLTNRFHLSGWVRNTSAGVELELEGEITHLEQFLTALKAEQPPLAVINRVERNFVPYGGEDLDQLRQRVCSFMDDMAKEPEDAVVAVVCHEGAMIMMLMQVLQCDLRYMPAHADNCCVSVFTYKSGKWTVNKWNETGNLIPEH